MKAMRMEVAPTSRSDPVHARDWSVTVVMLDMNVPVVGWGQAQRTVCGLVRAQCSGVMIVQRSFLWH